MKAPSKAATKAAAGSRTAIVTGGASGLGAAAARKLAKEGLRVVIADIDERRARDLAREIDPSGRRAAGLHCDISSAEECERLVSEAELFFGRPIDVFLANAGAGFAGPLLEADPAHIKRVIDINVLGTIYSAQAALRSLIKSGNGVLLLTASLQSVMARSQRSIYTTSKHALVGLVKGLALEFGPQGVRVNAIAPASTDTAFLRAQLTAIGGDVDAAVERVAQSMPLGHLPSTDDFAEAVAYLASSAARSVTGHTLLIDCGASAGRM
ncbi:MAG: SDR family NAD(P)-dependent oxidoreductase [Janthinobacterium lividum]